MPREKNERRRDKKSIIVTVALAIVLLFTALLAASRADGIEEVFSNLNLGGVMHGQDISSG